MTGALIVLSMMLKEFRHGRRRRRHKHPDAKQVVAPFEPRRHPLTRLTTPFLSHRHL